MSKGSVFRGIGMALLAALVVSPVFAAEYRVWDFTSAAECDIDGASDWHKNNEDKADWTGTWDGNTSLHIDFDRPNTPSEEARMQYNFPVPNTVTFGDYPYAKARLTVSGVPSGETINIELRVRFTVYDSRRVQAYFRVGNGTYTMTLDMAHPVLEIPPDIVDPSTELPNGVSFYNNQDSSYEFTPLAMSDVIRSRRTPGFIESGSDQTLSVPVRESSEETMLMFRLYFQLGTVPTWYDDYANIKVDIDWLALTTNPDYPEAQDCEWRKEGVPVEDSARISGAHSPALTFSPVLEEDAGTYTYAYDDGTEKVLVETEPFVLEVLEAGTLPVAGLAGLAAAAAALAGLAARRLRRSAGTPRRE